MPTVTLTHSDGTTDTIDNTVGWSWQREIGEMWKLTVDVNRADLSGISLEPKADELELGGVATGRLVDVQRGGPSWTLVAYSFEWDANREAPTGGGDRRTGDDQTLITNLINGVGTWTVGNVANLTGPMTFILNHSFAHEALRRIERNVPGELQFNDDKSVDYVDSRGSDKTGSITLSTANQNVDGEIQVQDRGRALDATHLRIIGAHEGEAQVTANLVPSDDPATYDNRVDYTTSRWSAGDTRDWDRWENKDVATQDTMDEEAASLGEELTESFVEVKATVVGEDLELGDWVHVEKTEADIDRDMRVHRIVTRGSGATERDEVLLSTRTVARDTENRKVRDIQRFNVAFQGSSVILQGGGSRQPISSTVDALETFRFPPVEYEHVTEIEVRGLPYRAYSSGAKSGGDHTHDVTVSHPDHSHDVTIDDTTASNTTYGRVDDRATSFGLTSISSSSWTDLDTFTPGSTTSEVWCYVRWETGIGDSSSYQLNFRVEDTNGNDYIPNANGHSSIFVDGDEYQMQALGIPGEHFNNDLILQAQMENSGWDFAAKVDWNAFGVHRHDYSTTETSEAALLNDFIETSDASGGHTHDPEPGVIAFPGETPSNVDILVNGSTVATDVGSGTFETTVDVTGTLTKDAWNDIRATSDSLGHISLSLYSETYKQVGTN